MTQATTNGAAHSPEPWELGPPEGFEDDAPALIPLLDGPALAEPLPDLAYLVRELAMVGGGGAPDLVAGYGYSGKTAALQSLALSLASGRRVWGAYVVRDVRRVVHVDLEQGRRLTQRRYQRLAVGMDVDLAGLGDCLVAAVMPPITLALQHEERWKELLTGRDLAIVDSLRAATGGQDENSSDIRSGLDMLGHLSEATGCRVMLIHHARKPSKDDPGGRYVIRGSGAIYDGSDGVWLFSATKGEPIRVEHLKARSHGELLDDLCLEIEDVQIGDDPRAGLRVAVKGAELIDERRAAQDKAKRDATARRDSEVVRGALARSPGIGTLALRGTTRLSGERVAAALAQLGTQVQVRQERHGSARAQACHYLAAENMDNMERRWTKVD